MNTINHLDLFSGLGGFSLGLREAGVQVDWHGFSDIDKYANTVFRERFPNAKELGSIEHIDIDKLPRIDIVTFGFPCQDLSIAGRRKGFDGSRSSLFFKAIEIIERKKPKYFVFENVKGFYSSNAGKDFTTALQTVADIGYDGQWQLLNTRWFLPQNRERVYFVGHIRGECRPKVFPIGEDEGQVKNKNLNQIGTIGDKDSEATRVYSTDGLARTIKNGGGMGAKTGLYEVKSAALRTYPRNSGMTKEEKKKRGKRLEIRDDNVANTITSHQLDSIIKENVAFKTYGIIPESDKPKGNWLPRERVLESNNGLSRAISTSQSQHPYYTDKTRIRRLTPLECERLQGFPDNWTEGQSDTQRYKQCGNAVSVPVIEAIVRKIYDL